ncbi:MAG: flavin reductase family protein [Rhizobiaceae bacterium]
MKRPDPADFRRAVSRFTTGVTVVTSRDRNNEIVALTANSFTSVSLSPPTVLVSVMSGRTLKAINASGRFGISVLPASAKELSSHFAGQHIPGLTPEFEDVGGSPKLAKALAYFDCMVEKAVIVADHTLLIGAVRDCRYADADPLVFYSSRYHQLGA